MSLLMKAAIFDVDGTLLDSMGIWESVGARYLKSQGIEAEPDLWKIMFTMSIEEGASYLKNQYHLAWTESEIVQGVQDIVRDFYYEEAELKPGARELLQYLDGRGVVMALATSSVRSHVEQAFKRLGIWDYFQVMYTCSEVGEGKRESARVYQEASEYLGISPKDTYVFEDVLHALETAKTAGYAVAGVYDSYSEKDQERIRQMSDVYLYSLMDYKKYI